MVMDFNNKESLLKFIGITEEQLWEAIREAALNAYNDGYTQSCEPIQCPYCKKDIWHYIDIFENIGNHIRDKSSKKE